MSILACTRLAAFSKAWGEISNANGLTPRRNGGNEMRQMSILATRDDIGEPLMTAFVLMVGQIFLERVAQGTFAKENQLIETRPFRLGVRPFALLISPHALGEPAGLGHRTNR